MKKCPNCGSDDPALCNLPFAPYILTAKGMLLDGEWTKKPHPPRPEWGCCTHEFHDHKEDHGKTHDHERRTRNRPRRRERRAPHEVSPHKNRPRRREKV